MVANSCTLIQLVCGQVFHILSKRRRAFKKKYMCNVLNTMKAASDKKWSGSRVEWLKPLWRELLLIVYTEVHGCEENRMP